MPQQDKWLILHMKPVAARAGIVISWGKFQALFGGVVPSPGELMWGVLFGSIGVGYSIYGRKQKRAIPFWCGVGLMVAPYFVPGTIPMVLASLALIAAPFIFRD